MPRKPHKYHYLYKTTCLVTQRFYYGVHSTSNLNDGYLGSGKRLRLSINRHGEENHVREIIENFLDRESLLKAEQALVNSDLLKDPMCMNLQLGGGGGWSSEAQSKNGIRGNATMRQLRETDQAWFDSARRKMSESFWKSVAEGRRSLPKYPNWSGKKHTDETKRKIGSINSKHQSGSGNSQYGKIWIYNELKRLSIRIEKTQIEEYVLVGWKVGRRMKF